MDAENGCQDTGCKNMFERLAAAARGAVWILCATAGGLALPAAAQDGAPGLCPGEPEGVPPGVYASALQQTITLSKGAEQLELSAGRTGFADQPRLTCLEETPEFIRRDRMPAPGEFGAAGAACGFAAGEGGDDLGLSSEWPRMERRFAEEIERFVGDGYPAESVIMHAVASGLTIDKTVYLMTRADADRAEEFFNAAFLLSDSLPGWACGVGSGSTRGGAYSPYYGVNDLPPRRTVAEVAQRYFDDFQVMEPLPDWYAGDFHMLAYTDELLELADDEERWYHAGDRQRIVDGNLQRAILVSLYGESRRIVLDISREEIAAFRDRGVERLPVVFYFNKDFQRPLTDIRIDDDLAGIIDQFHDDGTELTPVPLIAGGDHHLEVPMDDFEDLFEIPAREEIDDARYAALVDELARDGFSRRPVVVTLYSEHDGRWLDDPARIRAAIDAGIEQAPVAVLYHRLGRLPCGATPSCVRRVCEALTCAGGAPAACQVDPALREGTEPPPPPPPSVGGNPSPS